MSVVAINTKDEKKINKIQQSISSVYIQCSVRQTKIKV